MTVSVAEVGGAVDAFRTWHQELSLYTIEVGGGDDGGSDDTGGDGGGDGTGTDGTGDGTGTDGTGDGAATDDTGDGPGITGTPATRCSGCSGGSAALVLPLFLMGLRRAPVNRRNFADSLAPERSGVPAHAARQAAQEGEAACCGDAGPGRCGGGQRPPPPTKGHRPQRSKCPEV